MFGVREQQWAVGSNSRWSPLVSQFWVYTLAIQILNSIVVMTLGLGWLRPLVLKT